MNPIRRRKMSKIIASLLLLGVVAGLLMYALRQNINLFYSPSQLVESGVSNARLIRIGGMVVKGSVVRSEKDLSVRFTLTDYKHTVTVNFKGILPDLFREGQGIVALGYRVDNQHFKATEVLAKHDANYMPPEIKASLAKTTSPGAA